MQFNDNLATRRARDQRPRPLREFSVGDEVAVWRRSTGKGAGVHNGVVMASSWGQSAVIILRPCMPGSVIKAAHEQLRHRTAEEQETDRVVLRDLRRTADVSRETGSAKNFEDITEQDWPDGDLNPTAEGVEPSQETPENQLPSDRRRLVRKTPPSGVDGTRPDPRNEHVVQTPADAPSQHELPTSMEQLDVRQPTVELETTPFLPVLETVSKPTRLRNHVQNSHVSESECIHHHCQCQFRPFHFHTTSLRRFSRLLSLWKILKRRKSK